MADQGNLDPQDYNWFRTSNRKINDTYQLGASQNQYQQDSLRNAYARQQGDTARQFTQARSRLPGSFARRGMLNSGAYQRALTDFATARSTANANQLGAFNDQLGGYQLARSQLEQTRSGGIMDLADMETARRTAVYEALQKAKL